MNTIKKPANSFWVGLTGGVASGKSAVEKELLKLGAAVIDADQIARQVVQPGRPELQQIADYFGGEYIQEDGHLNRRMMRERIFAHDQDRIQLEKILHGSIRQELLTQAITANDHAPFVVLMVPILAKLNLASYLDHFVTVDSDEEQQIQRLCSRDAMDLAGAKAMLAAQESRQQRLDIADTVINNNGSFEQLQSACVKLHNKLLELSKQSIS